MDQKAHERCTLTPPAPIPDRLRRPVPSSPVNPPASVGVATERLFVSIALPDPCRAALDTLKRPAIQGVGWSSSSQFHLTLRFLGDTSNQLMPGIEEHLSQIRVEPFILPLLGVGSFPPRRGTRVLWAGLGSGHSRLFQLRQKVDDALLAAGWRGHLYSFSPHITLGRVTGALPDEVQAWTEQHRDFEGPPFRVDAFALMSSQLNPSGSVHRLVKRFVLRSK